MIQTRPNDINIQQLKQHRNDLERELTHIEATVKYDETARWLEMAIQCLDNAIDAGSGTSVEDWR